MYIESRLSRWCGGGESYLWPLCRWLELCGCNSTNPMDITNITTLRYTVQSDRMWPTVNLRVDGGPVLGRGGLPDGYPGDNGGCEKTITLVPSRKETNTIAEGCDMDRKCRTAPQKSQNEIWKSWQIWSLFIKIWTFGPHFAAFSVVFGQDQLEFVV